MVIIMMTCNDTSLPLPSLPPLPFPPLIPSRVLRTGHSTVVRGCARQIEVVVVVVVEEEEELLFLTKVLGSASSPDMPIWWLCARGVHGRCRPPTRCPPPPRCPSRHPSSSSDLPSYCTLRVRWPSLSFTPGSRSPSLVGPYCRSAGLRAPALPSSRSWVACIHPVV
jgi:hypothetical protein